MKKTKSAPLAALLLALLLCGPMTADAARFPCARAAVYRPPIHWQCPHADCAVPDNAPTVPDAVPGTSSPDHAPDPVPGTSSPDYAPDPVPGTNSPDYSEPDAVPGTNVNPVPDYPAPVSPAQTADSGIAPYEAEVIRLVNEIRVQHGLNALTADADLCRFARVKSQDMRDRRYFSHDSPTYGTPFQMMKSFGVTYRTAGENIAYGYASPQAVVNGWMNSEGHRANILNPSYTRIGVGYAAEGHYWTQWFTG